MTLGSLGTAHLTAAIVTLALGLVVLLAAKGSPMHRLFGLGYVGAMGSRMTHQDRLQRLREAGLSDVEIDRLSSPIGLDLGARTPEETAVSIGAEIVSQRWGGQGGRLSELSGRIHHAAS